VDGRLVHLAGFGCRPHAAARHPARGKGQSPEFDELCDHRFGALTLNFGREIVFFDRQAQSLTLRSAAC
jgi:hypothetical protein